ncbi:MAG: acetyltransferase [Aequorivita sp.]|nr:acetyltransferase [Aequorivita sp.]MBG43500.1 acetyltransferase [Aequorivita sp.]MBP42527.1 acetyltransferase [Aequorivita sp.]|tara:strand:- start:5192 stop:5779 length:588 start_codon:yes stop_codon:yes gene_type:complete
MMKRIKGLFNQLFYKCVTYWVYTFEDLHLGKKVVFKLMPQILKHNDAKISIGNGSTINSSNFGYHINMFSKCKLFADRPNAVIEIGENTRVHGTCIHAFNKIQIGNNCLIAANTNIIDGNGHELCMENPENRINTKDHGNPIIIADNVWIAANCIILGGTKIGEGAIITAGSIVKGNVPAKSIFGGNPAILIKQY